LGFSPTPDVSSTSALFHDLAAVAEMAVRHERAENVEDDSAGELRGRSPPARAIPFQARSLDRSN
jgi:hypothetical protein